MLGIIKKRDIASGDMLFGERLQLVQIIRKEDTSEIERIKDIIECLHGFRPSTARAILMYEYACNIAEAVVSWVQREHEECSAPVSLEAERAGVADFSKAIGEMGYVVSLAERFGLVPFQRVYELPYLEVFAIWKTDAETAKFNQRLRKVQEQESKRK